MTFLARLRRRLAGARGDRQDRFVREAILGSLPVGAGKGERHRLWRVLLWAVLALVLLQIESGLLVHVPAPHRIDVTALFLVFLSLEVGLVEGALSAFAVGYVADLFVLGPPGLCRFLAVAIWTGCHLALPRNFGKSPVGLALLAFLVSGLFQAGVLGAETLVLAPWQAPGTNAWLSVVPTAGWTAAASIPLVRALCRLDRLTSGSVVPSER